MGKKQFWQHRAQPIFLSILWYLNFGRWISSRGSSRDILKCLCPAVQTHENIFLILPCIAALCISVTCLLLLFAIVASVILFQKLVQYNEETGKRAILENQVRQMQKEIVEIQDIYTDMRGLRHDMRSHMANISLLVKSVSDSVNEELENYIGKMEKTDTVSG